MLKEKRNQASLKNAIKLSKNLLFISLTFSILPIHTYTKFKTINREKHIYQKKKIQKKRTKQFLNKLKPLLIALPISIISLTTYYIGKNQGTTIPNEIISPEQQNKLKNKVLKLEKEVKNYESLFKKPKNTLIRKNLELEKKVKNCRSLLAEKQSELMKKQGAFNVKSNFPTIKEFINDFEDLRNTSHAKSSTSLSKLIQKRHKGCNKYYAYQLSYQLLFDLLMVTHRKVIDHRNDIYNTIAQKLEIEKVLENKDKNMKLDKLQISQTNNTIEFMFGYYLKANHDLIIEQSLTKLTNQILNNSKIQKKYSAFYKDLKETIDEYIKESIKICWQMVLMSSIRSRIDFYPLKFWDKKTTFDKKKHKKCRGSEKRMKTIQIRTKYYMLYGPLSP